MSPQELKNLLKLLRSQGVLRYENGDLKLELSETIPRKERRGEPVENQEEPRELTYEEQLFYSADPPTPQEGDN